MLELYDGKLSCTVLRGGSGRKARDLPGTLRKTMRNITLKTKDNVLFPTKGGGRYKAKKRVRSVNGTAAPVLFQALRK